MLIERLRKQSCKEKMLKVVRFVVVRMMLERTHLNKQRNTVNVGKMDITSSERICSLNLPI